MNDKEIMSKVLKSYICDLKAGRKPKVLKMFKENPDLARNMAPLIHITRLSMINEGTLKISNLNPKKSKKLSDNLINKVKNLKNNEQAKSPGIKSFPAALAFRKNSEEQEEDNEDYTSKAIEELMKKMDE